LSSQTQPIEELLRLEQELLQFLVAGRIGAEARQAILLFLHNYKFRSVEHQVLFDCLSNLAAYEPHQIQELLPARLVRAGFPDIELQSVSSANLTAAQAEELCRKLIGEEVQS
jgi:hypothetical protein